MKTPIESNESEAISNSRPSWVWRSPYGGVRAIWAVAILIFAIGVIANPLVILLDSTDLPVLENSLKNVCVAIAVGVGIWAVILLNRSRWSEFGINGGVESWGAFVYGLLAGGGLLTFSVLIAIGFGGYRFSYSPGTNFEGVPVSVALSGQALRYLAGSIFEELASRGLVFYLVYRSLPDKSVLFRNVLALLVSSVLFGLLHLGNSELNAIAIVNLILLGALFGVLYLYSQNLIVPIGAHFAWNFFQNNVFGLPNGGQSSNAMLFEPNSISESVVFGDTLGPEGSLVVSALLAIVVISLCALTIRHQLPIGPDKSDRQLLFDT